MKIKRIPPIHNWRKWAKSAMGFEGIVNQTINTIPPRSEISLS